MSYQKLSGGLGWHWQAWRSQNRWLHSVKLLANWLEIQSIPKTHEKLLIIGASAGWMMPNQWLCQFKEVETFDIDPLAPILFRLNHGRALKKRGVKLSCQIQDGIQFLPQLLKHNPNAAIFFDNVLGQLRFISPTLSKAEQQLGEIKLLLAGRSWGSIHDRMSGEIYQSNRTGQDTSSTHTRGLLENELEIQAWLTKINAQSPWLDHLTENVFPTGTAIENFTWAFKRNYVHWLQAGWVHPY